MNLVKRLAIFGTITIASLAIGQSASARFVIFVSGNDPVTLQKVRTISPSAFATKINSQPVIQAGIFNSETSADSLAIALQQSGLTAQKYFRSSGGKESDVQVPFLENVASSVAPLSSLPNPQQVVIQQSQPTQSFQTDVLTSVPQQVVAYNNPQYQQITTNTIVPQVQTQQVLVPRWQQVLVPETRQIVTQNVVPQTQLVQSSYVQPSCVQPTVQSTGYTQTVAYTQPQNSFIVGEAASVAPVNYDNPVGTTNNFALQPQPTSTASNSNQTQLPQATQNPNFRYVAAVPATATNQFLLSRVRQYVPNAFLSSSGRGTYIHAGAYQNRDSAESVSRYLRSQGVDSRVLYF